MADKTTITPQQRFKVLTKLFEAGFKSEKDLQSINFQNVFRIEGLTVQDMSMITLCMSETHDQRAVRKMSNKRVYTVEEIEAILGISKNTAYALVKSGEFHSVKIGGQYRISKKSFDDWLDNVGADTGSCQVCDA